MSGEQIASRLARLAPVGWEEAVDRLSAEERSEAARFLEGMATGYARLAAYVNARARPTTHQGAIKHQNTVARKIRKVFGYQHTIDLRV